MSLDTSLDCQPDPRLLDALRWCREHGLASITVAVPFVLDQSSLVCLPGEGSVSALVCWPGQAGIPDGLRVGWFRPERFDWSLPADGPRHILLLEGRSALTWRMLIAAWKQSVRSITYWDFGRWRRRSLSSLLLHKMWSKVAVRCATAGLGPVGRVCDGLLGPAYRRAIDAVVATRLLPTGPDAGSGVIIACPTLVAGGAERQIVNTARGLRTAGIGPITVLVARLHNPPGNDFFLGALRNIGVEVRDLAAGALKRWLYTKNLADTDHGQTALNPFRQFPDLLAQDVLDLCVELATLRPAVLHCWLDYSNVRAGLAGVCCNIPRIILSGRNVNPRHFPYIYEPFMRASYQALLSQRGVTLTNNSELGAADYARWLGIPVCDVRVIYNGVDLNRFQRADPPQIRCFREQIGIKPHHLVVGSLFRFSSEKRPLLWLRVAQRVLRRRKDVTFVVFGAGPMKGEMESFVASSDLAPHVHLLPPTSDSALALSSFDLLLLASEWEGTPNVVIEAQAVGTPVLVTGGGGAREALADGATGCFVSGADATDIANTLLAMLADPVQLARMGEAGPRFVAERFGMARMVRETAELYYAPPT